MILKFSHQLKSTKNSERTFRISDPKKMSKNFERALKASL